MRNPLSYVKASKMRWVILFLICLMYLISYLDRVNISAAAPLIQKEFGFSKVTMGIIFSVFIWPYALLQVLGGWISDRYGPRKVLTAIAIWWSIMTALTARGFNLASFMVIRFLLGVGESGAFPTSTTAMQAWYAPEERGFAQGITHGFSRIGAAIAPAISVAIIVAFGWRAVFWIFGLFGIAWAIIWYIVFRNMPEEHHRVNKAELAHIRGTAEIDDTKAIHTRKKPSIAWGTLFRSSNMWALMFNYFTYCYCLWIFLTWLPTYLVEYRHFTLLKMGMFASLPLLAGFVGDTVGGWFSDYLLIKTKKMALSRRLVAITGMAGCAIFIVPAAITSKPYSAVIFLTLAMFFLEFVVGPSWATSMDMGGEHAGTVAGTMNAFGTTGGAISPMVFGILIQYGSWVAPFISAACLLVAGIAIWAFWLDPEVPVFEKEKRPVAAAVEA